MSLVLDIDLLLPLLERYQKAFWACRKHDVQGYLLHHDLTERQMRGEIDDEQFEATMDAHHMECSIDSYGDMQSIQARLLRFLQGPAPEDVLALENELIEKVGEW